MLLVLLVTTGSIMAQRPDRPMRGKMNHPGLGKFEKGAMIAEKLELSDEQKVQLKDLRMKHQQDMRYTQNLIKEKEAHLRTLLSAADRDKKAIEKTIDDVAATKASLLKKRLNNQDEMEAIFTPEQLKKVKALKQFTKKRGQRIGKQRANHLRQGRTDNSQKRGHYFHGRGFDRPGNRSGFGRGN